MFLDNDQKSFGENRAKGDPLAKEEAGEGKLFLVKMISPNPCCGVRLTVHGKFAETTAHLFKLEEAEFTRSVVYVVNFGTPSTIGVYDEEYAKDLLSKVKRHISKFYCNPGLDFFIEKAP